MIVCMTAYSFNMHSCYLLKALEISQFTRFWNVNFKNQMRCRVCGPASAHQTAPSFIRWTSPIGAARNSKGYPVCHMLAIPPDIRRRTHRPMKGSEMTAALNSQYWSRFWLAAVGPIPSRLVGRGRGTTPSVTARTNHSASLDSRSPLPRRTYTRWWPRSTTVSVRSLLRVVVGSVNWGCQNSVQTWQILHK